MTEPETKTRDGWEAVVILTVQGFGPSTGADELVQEILDQVDRQMENFDTRADDAQFCNAVFSKPYLRRLPLPEDWYDLGDEDEE